MVHPNLINFSAIRTTSNVNGDSAQSILNLYSAKVPDGEKCGTTFEPDQSGLAVMVDCCCDKTYAEKVLIEPRLAELVFTEEDRLSCLPEGCENLTDKQAYAIVHTIGDPDITWEAPLEGP